mmetsp:Transcript_24973/g.69920  ORF Transcript_24973/g.69920 Transcript_24973/m.69920 type:complete len:257 (-) Transcript_24973:276-1046(-)
MKVEHAAVPVAKASGDGEEARPHGAGRVDSPRHGLVQEQIVFVDCADGIRQPVVKGANVNRIGDARHEELLAAIPVPAKGFIPQVVPKYGNANQVCCDLRPVRLERIPQSVRVVVHLLECLPHALGHVVCEPRTGGAPVGVSGKRLGEGTPCVRQGEIDVEWRDTIIRAKERGEDILVVVDQRVHSLLQPVLNDLPHHPRVRLVVYPRRRLHSAPHVAQSDCVEPPVGILFQPACVEQHLRIPRCALLDEIGPAEQ